MTSALARAKAEIAAQQALRNPRYQRFRRQYWSDPVAFVHDCFTWRDAERPTDYQAEIMAAVPIYKRVSGRGPHGLGKSAMASWLELWFALTRDVETDWKIPSTASVWRQLSKFLYPEIHKWARRLRWDVIGRAPFNRIHELQTLSIKLSSGEAFAVASNESSAIEGAHATQLLYVFDEAKAIPSSTWDAAEGAFSNAGTDTRAEAYALAISTPGETAGRFYDIQTRKPGTQDWWVRHVKLEEALAAGRISQEWVEARRQEWGEQSSVFRNRVMGEFADSGEENVIPLSWVEKAVQRWRDCLGIGDGRKSYGVDVAWRGADQTAICRLVGRVCERIDYYPQQSTMETAGRVAALIGQDTRACIDVIGVGAGVYDRLRELGHDRVMPVNVAESTFLRDSSGQLEFMNLRSALWWALRDALNPDNPAALALPDDPRLIGDLTAPRWTYTSSGKIKIESKDDIRKRIGRSTDAADALGMAVYAGLLPEKLEALVLDVEW